MMYFFFEVLKGIFFFLTILIGLLFLRGEVIVGKEYFPIVKQIMMPGYLIFCGLMLGYIIARIWLGNDDEHPKQREIYIKSFIIGIGIGLILSILYVVA